MKFKLFQIATLLAFVTSIVYMAQTPNGYGHDASEHPPEFYVDDNGDYAGTKPTGPDGETYKDPRVDRDYSGSSGNGTESASSWALRYYASGLINGNHSADDEPEMVYGARVDLSASAGNSSCSGSAMPSLTDDMGLTADHTGWSGRGRIVLEISGKEGAHFQIPDILMTIPPRVVYHCVFSKDVDESKYDTGPKDIRIEVSATVITESDSTEISAEVSYGSAKVSGKRTGSVSKSSTGVYSYPTGIEASLTVSAWNRAWNVDSQLDKSANVSGNLGEPIEPDSIYAVFEGEHESYLWW